MAVESVRQPYVRKIVRQLRLATPPYNANASHYLRDRMIHVKLSIALATVIAGSPMIAQAQAGGPSDAAADDQQSSDVVVTGRAERLYRVDTTTVGKVAEDPLNIPQALQVINADLFTD